MEAPTSHHIYSNELYSVITGPSQIVEDMTVYLVVNKNTGIVEAEDQMLPKIIDYAEQLNDKTAEVIAEYNLELDIKEIKPH